MNILLVDDDCLIRESLGEILSIQGHRIFDFDNGQTALDYINTTEYPIHLILSDICMPKLNGIELLESVRSRGQLTPAIFITGYASPQLINAAHALNAAIFNKPLDYKSLKLFIDSL